MPINLKKQEEEKLQEGLIKAIGSAIVKNGSFLDFQFYRDMVEQESLLNTGSLRLLTEILGDYPTAEFFYRRIKNRLADCGHNYDAEASVCLLTDKAGFEDAVAVAHQIIEELKTLPWQYSLFMKLPLKADCGIPEEYELSPKLKLRLCSDDRMPNFKYKKIKDDTLAMIGAMLCSSPYPPFGGWSDNAFYLNMRGEGFVSDFYDSKLVMDFADHVEAFVGAGLALDLFAFVKPNTRMMPPTTKSQFHIFKASDGEFVAENDHEADKEMCSGICNLAIDDKCLPKKEDEKVKSVFADLFPRSSNWGITTKLDQLQRLFRDNKYAKKTRIAAQWYLRGLCDSRATMSYAQLITVIDSLISQRTKNDQDVSLTTLIAERYAAIVGANFKAMDDFKKIIRSLYRTRCRILHDGISRLDEEQMKDYYKLKLFAKVLIVKSIGLLKLPEVSESDNEN